MMAHSQAQQIRELDSNELYHACDVAALEAAIAEQDAQQQRAPVGQQRALDALELGIGMRHAGYNLFVMGSAGLGKHSAVQRVLSESGKQGGKPQDICYVYNFQAPNKPRALRLPSGMGKALKTDMQALARELFIALPALFESDEFRARKQEIDAQFKAREEKAFAEVSAEAEKREILLLQTPMGWTIAPARDGSVIEPDDFEKLTEDEKKEIEAASEAVRKMLAETIHQAGLWQKEHRQRIEELSAEFAGRTVENALTDARKRYAEQAGIIEHLEAVQKDVVEHVDEILKFAGENKLPPDIGERASPFQRYDVNVLVGNGERDGAPVVYEDNPTYQNLVGRIEHVAHFGTLMTNFTLVKGGALHRANGGYLILDALKLLSHPFAWDALKRTLRARELRIQSLEQMLSLASTITLEPEPIPLDVKVVLIGERILYYLLSAYDPEFGTLFKVQADFSEDLERNSSSTHQFADLIGRGQRDQELLPHEAGAVARLVEHMARRSGDAQRLSLNLENLLDVQREADYWARRGGSQSVRREDVEQAIASGIRRADQIRERMQESVMRDIRIIDTSGAEVGQVNGLAVIQLAGHMFGQPTRITATARLGDGEVIDIEREAELGQAIHSKGVLILSAYLAHRFARDEPLSLTASLAFEQSYGPVDGDSASTAELCALLSALAGLPVRQDLALTGSVNQHGAVQAIGGVNEKIEGFFDLCQARGLSGTQGVIIPEANQQHLMLRADVVDAVANGRFHVYAARHVDEVIALLTTTPAGEAAVDGNFAEGTVNGRVQRRLHRFSELRQQFSTGAKGKRA